MVTASLRKPLGRVKNRVSQLKNTLKGTFGSPKTTHARPGIHGIFGDIEPPHTCSPGCSPSSCVFPPWVGRNFSTRSLDRMIPSNEPLRYSPNSHAPSDREQQFSKKEFSPENRGKQSKDPVAAPTSPCDENNRPSIFETTQQNFKFQSDAPRTIYLDTTETSPTDQLTPLESASQSDRSNSDGNPKGSDAGRSGQGPRRNTGSHISANAQSELANKTPNAKEDKDLPPDAEKYSTWGLVLNAFAQISQRQRNSPHLERKRVADNQRCKPSLESPNTPESPQKPSEYLLSDDEINPELLQHLAKPKLSDLGASIPNPAPHSDKSSEIPKCTTSKTTTQSLNSDERLGGAGNELIKEQLPIHTEVADEPTRCYLQDTMTDLEFNVYLEELNRYKGLNELESLAEVLNDGICDWRNAEILDGINPDENPSIDQGFESYLRHPNSAPVSRLRRHGTDFAGYTHTPISTPPGSPYLSAVQRDELGSAGNTSKWVPQSFGVGVRLSDLIDLEHEETKLTYAMALKKGLPINVGDDLRIARDAVDHFNEINVPAAANTQEHDSAGTKRSGRLSELFGSGNPWRERQPRAPLAANVASELSPYEPSRVVVTVTEF